MKTMLTIMIGLSMAAFTARITAMAPVEIASAKGSPVRECRCEYSWQHDYAEYINDLGYYAGIYIADINGDGIPEAVIDINTLGSTVVLYYNEDGMQELNLETISAWGSVTYISDTGQLLYSPFYGHTTGTWGYEEYYLYDWTGREYVQTFSMLRESGYYLDADTYEYGESRIDGERVDNDTFEKKLAEIERLKDENRGSIHFRDMEEDGVEDRVKEILPCFQMP